MIIYFYTDGGNIVFQNKIYPIQKGSMCFVRAGQQHYTLPDKPDRYDRSKIFVREQAVEEILNLGREDKALQRLFENSAVIYAKVSEEHREDVEKIYARAEYCLHTLEDVSGFLCCFFQLLLYLRDFSCEQIAKADDNLTKAIAFINRHYASAITLDDICRESYVSKYYLCRSFKNSVGMTIMEYLLKTRLVAAQNHLISDETLSIGEISEACGFSGISYFSQIFKKNTGLSPNQYRKRYGKRQDSV